MTALVFVAAPALSVLVFELLSGLQYTFAPHRLKGIQSDSDRKAKPARRSTWFALLLVLWPQRFDAEQARDRQDVISQLRRAGYPFDTPGEFYAAAMRTFSVYLGLGALAAGFVVANEGSLLAALVLAGLFTALGLRWPHKQLQMKTEKRAKAMRNNMLTGLAMMSSLLEAGIGVQETLRRTASVGGPFCNLLGLLNARMEIEDFNKAIRTTEAHVADPSDVEMKLFLRDVQDYFINNRPLLAGVKALHEAVHRNVVEETEARASVIARTSGLFGGMSVIGMVMSIAAPFMSVVLGGF